MIFREHKRFAATSQHLATRMDAGWMRGERGEVHEGSAAAQGRES